MPSEYYKILEFSEYWKSDKKPSIIYEGLKSQIKRIDRLKIIFEKLSTIKQDNIFPVVIEYL